MTLNRPAALNALGPRLIVELAGAWRELAEDRDVRAIVLTGAGERAFCAGADLKRYIPLASGARQPEDEWDRAVLSDPGLLDVALLRTFDVGKPIVAAVAGDAVGGGFELVQATDLRVMSNTASLALKEVHWGLFPSGGSTVLLPRQLPWAVAMELLLSGRPLPATEALARGFVNQICDAGQVLAEAQKLARAIARLSPLAVQAIRRSARAARSIGIEAGMALEQEIARPIFLSEDAAEGLAAFAER
ncbi:MAG TPA: enoyl-CoA hydratase-related protein, partial [Phenylobacterium sp.]|nr:enoyl-CoA hydratase-related protein [Phenylobacterium sp.]